MSTSRPTLLICPGFIQNDAAFATPNRSLLTAIDGWGYDVVSLLDFAPRRRTDRFADYVDAAARCISSLSPSTRIGFLGHSMGGLIGVSLAPDAAARLSALVVAGTPLFPGFAFSHHDGGPSFVIEAVQLGRFQRTLRATAEGLGRAGIGFPGRLLGLGFRASQRVLDVKRLRYPLQIWAPKNLDRRELSSVLKTSFSSDSFLVLADLLDLSISDGAHAGDVATGARLGALTCPLFCIAGKLDGVAPPDASRALFDRAGSNDKTWHLVEADQSTQGLGHVDLLTSEIAEQRTWPRLREFLDQHLRDV